MIRKFALQIFALLGALMVAPIPSWPDTPRRVIVVKFDIGGRIDRRVAAIEGFRRRGDRIEIRGRVCFSACTLYLGAGDVCVEPETVFGFHGPSLWGLPLNQTSFEYWSEMIASHYNPALRTWYLETARYRVNGFHRLSGHQIIALGYAPCVRGG